jgi:ABC-2 type transport system permease protein
MRALIIHQVFRADLMIEAFALNAVWFAGGVVGFRLFLRSARREGTLLQGGD